MSAVCSGGSGNDAEVSDSLVVVRDQVASVGGGVKTRLLYFAHLSKSTVASVIFGWSTGTSKAELSGALLLGDTVIIGVHMACSNWKL